MKKLKKIAEIQGFESIALRSILETLENKGVLIKRDDGFGTHIRELGKF